MNFKLELSPVPQTDFYHLLPVRCGWSWEKAQSCTAGAEDGSEQSRHRESRHRRDGEGFAVKTATAVGRLPRASAVHCTPERPLSVSALRRSLWGLHSQSRRQLFVIFSQRTTAKMDRLHMRNPQISHFKVYSDHKLQNILINFPRNQTGQSAAHAWRWWMLEHRPYLKVHRSKDIIGTSNQLIGTFNLMMSRVFWNTIRLWKHVVC